MKRHTLLLGLQGSGKTFKANELHKENPRCFLFDEVFSVEKIRKYRKIAKKASTLAIIATQLHEHQIPEKLLKKFQVIHCQRNQFRYA